MYIPYVLNRTLTYTLMLPVGAGSVLNPLLEMRNINGHSGFAEVFMVICLTSVFYLQRLMLRKVKYNDLVLHR